MKAFLSACGIAASTGLFFAPLAAGAGFSGNKAVSMYWGANSYGASNGSLAQQHLSTYCSNTNVDIIPMSFMVKITSGKGGKPVINFANSGDTCTIFPGTDLWSCPGYADEIKTCQQKYGKTILLSIGGDAYTEKGFTSQAQAISAANLVWETFGTYSNTSTAPRPFYDAVVDGFDLNFESKGAYYRAFGLRLRALMTADKSKPYYLTAAPTCTYPNPALDPVFNDPNGGVPFDAVFVQFYNSDTCGVQTYTAGTASQAKFNLATWHNWATSKSANKNVKIFIGVPAGKTGAGSGYQTAAQLKNVVNYGKTFSSFGGVMAWDASQAYANKPWLTDVKKLLTTAAKARRSSWDLWRRFAIEV